MRISDTSDSIQILPNSNSLAELTNLVYSYIFNYEWYNNLLLLGWDNSTYRNIHDKVIQLCTTDIDHISQDDSLICLEYFCRDQSKRNVYTLINFDCNILRSIVDKHYILSSICQSNKTNLTIVYNNQNKGLQEQLDSLTQQCCNNSCYSDSRINFLDIDQFRDFVGDILGLFRNWLR
ncbi:hypothetical protein [Orientia tsutsugamushi]|nr:hypothetical protein [Orientia tsutsugamushi]